MNKENYVIGVDGGGTKTITALANFEGEILKQIRSGPSNLRNLGIESAIDSIAFGISEAIDGIKKENIAFVVVGLAAVDEEFKDKKEGIKKMLSEKTGIPGLKIGIVSDQLVAFKSGTDEEKGVVLISGTGAVCHGWWKGQEAKTSGWGWLNDEGSGFWIGQRAFQAIFRALDGRGKDTKISDLIFKQFEVANKEELMAKIYQNENLPRAISLMSIAVDEAEQKGDKIAGEILSSAAKELSESAVCVIKKLDIEKENFPLVLVGKMFISKIVLEEAKKEVKKIAPHTEFIRPKQETVVGAIKLAIKKLG